MPIEQEININDFPAVTVTPAPDEPAGNPDGTPADDTPDPDAQQPDGGEEVDDTPADDTPEEPDVPAPDPRDEAIEALRAELAEERRARAEMMERIAPKPAGEQEVDYDALVAEHFEPDSAAGKVFRKLASTMKTDFERKLQRAVGGVRQSTESMEMEQRESRVIESLVGDGSIKREDVQTLREAAWNGAMAARKRGEKPDLESSYKAAAFDLVRKRGLTRGDEEAKRRAALAKRKGLATAPKGATPTRPAGAKLSDAEISKAVREGKSIRDIWAMEDAGKDE